MKRYIIIILMFAIISVSCTAIMIYIKNNSSNKMGNSEITTETEDVINVETENVLNTNTIPNNKTKEKTLDLYGVHDENDLIIEEKYMDYEGNDIESFKIGDKNTITYIEISGLKDKKVENKINKKIKDTAYNNSKKILEIDGIKNCYFHCLSESNFSNTLSVRISCSGYTGEIEQRKYHYEDATLNFELIKGEELKFEDLFAKDADLNKAPTLALYRTIAYSTRVGERRAI